MNTIYERAVRLRGEIVRLETCFARTAKSVTLIGISKTHPAAAVREAFDAGIRHFGESYVQEAVPKIAALADLGITWHFVGGVQGNKTAVIAATFDWVHSVDRQRIAERLNAQRPVHLPALQCCIEVNLDGQNTKGGVSPMQLDSLAAAISGMPRLRLRGLMTLPDEAPTLAAQRAPFARLADCFARLSEKHPGMDTLSMGMSADMEAAIAEGATMVRIGTALFGPRGKPVPGPGHQEHT